MKRIWFRRIKQKVHYHAVVKKSLTAAFYFKRKSMSKFQIYNSDCLEKLKDIPAGSIDLILADPPYGTTHCKWDVVIPFAPL